MSRKNGAILLKASLAIFLSALTRVHAENLISNPSFERGADKWGLWIAPDSQDKNCQFMMSSDSPHSDQYCARLVSDDFARFSIGPRRLVGHDDIIPVQGGERFRISLWVRGDPSIEIQPGKAGLLVRCEFLSDRQGVKGGMTAYIGLNNKVSVRSPIAGLEAFQLTGEFPKQWTKVEGVFEVPSNVNGLDGMTPPCIFSWYSKGSIFVDDVTFEKVDENVPLSPTID